MTYRHTCYFMIAAIICTACGKSFLDSPPRNLIPRESYTTDLNACQEQLLGCHMQLSNAFGDCTVFYADLAADNMNPVTGSNYFEFLYNWKMRATAETSLYFSGTDPNLNLMAYRFYSIARTASYVIEKATALRGENAARADHITGSALILRTIAHYYLVNLLAQPYSFTAKGTHPGIVYVTTSDWNLPVKGREPVADIYRHMQDDLLKAAAMMQPATDSNATVSRQTAYALLSRTSLYAEQYAIAMDAAQKALEGRTLLTINKGYPDDLFRHLTISRSESYLQLLPGSSQALKYKDGGFFPAMFYSLIVFFTASAGIADELQNDAQDVRSAWVKKDPQGWLISKFPAGAVPDVQPAECAYFQPVIRVSEVMLNAAEAAWHLQQHAASRQYLNNIRLRARPGGSAINPDGAALLDSIRAERRKELAFEGFRLFDLLRWKMPVKRKDPLSANAATLPYPDNRAIAPIPQIDVSLPGIPQNNGY